MNRVFVIIVIILGFFGYMFYVPKARTAINRYEQEQWEDEDYYYKEDTKEESKKPTVEEEEEEAEDVQSQTEYKHIIEIKPKQLKSMNSGSYILILTGTTCPHCLQYKPVLDEVLTEYDIDAYDIDMWVLDDAERKVVTDITGNIDGVPTTVIIKNGKVEDKRVGGLSKTQVEDLLKTNGFIK